MRLGCIHLICDSPPAKWPVSNRGVWRINPARANGKEIFANYHGYFAGRVDPITNWLEGGATKESALHDFERPFGSVGVWRREWSIADGVESRSEGKAWMMDFPLASLAHTRSGREIVCHMGGLELDDWAKRVRRQDSWGASADALDVIRDTYGPLIRAGVRIGVDAASAEGINSADYGAVTLLRALGASVQIESTPPLASHWWKGVTCRMAWSDEFRWRHVNQDITSAKKFPKLGTPEFRAAYPDVRVSVFGGQLATDDAKFYSTTASRKALLEIVAEKSRMLMLSGCTVLLDAETIEMAMLSGMPASEFYPEGVL